MLTLQSKLIGVVLGFMLISGVLFGAYKWVGNSAVEEYKQSVATAQAEANKIQQDKYDELAASYEVEKASKKIVYKTLTKVVERIVEKPVYKTQCIDAEGVEAANKALSGGKDELF